MENNNIKFIFHIGMNHICVDFIEVYTQASLLQTEYKAIFIFGKFHEP